MSNILAAMLSFFAPSMTAFSFCNCGDVSPRICYLRMQVRPKSLKTAWVTPALRRTISPGRCKTHSTPRAIPPVVRKYYKLTVTTSSAETASLLAIVDCCQVGDPLKTSCLILVDLGFLNS